MGTNYIAPIWRMPRNANNTPVDKLSNYSINLANANERISLTDGVDLGVNSTVSLWVNFSTNNNSVILADDVNPSSSGYFLLLNTLTGDTYVRIGSSFGSTPFNTSWNLNQWYNIIIVRQDDTVELFKDNLSLGTRSGYGTTNTTKFDCIGAKNDQTFPMYGQISQVVGFDYALSTNQRDYIYNLNNPMVPGTVNLTAPVAYWPLGDNSNPNAPGSFPNISVGADSVFDFTPNDYIIADVDGTGGSDSSFELGSDLEFTVSFWFNRSSSSSQIGLFQWANVITSGSPFLLIQQNSNNLRVFYDGGYRTYTVTSQNIWYHITITRTATDNTLRGYLNGSEWFSYDDGGTPALQNVATNIYFGNGYGNYFTGQLSNGQIWNTALSSTEIETLYNNGQPLMTGTQPQEDNLQAWYKLNQSANYNQGVSGLPFKVSIFQGAPDYSSGDDGAYTFGGVFRWFDNGTTSTVPPFPTDTFAVEFTTIYGRYSNIIPQSSGGSYFTGSGTKPAVKFQYNIDGAGWVDFNEFISPGGSGTWIFTSPAGVNCNSSYRLRAIGYGGSDPSGFISLSNIFVTSNGVSLISEEFNQPNFTGAHGGFISDPNPVTYVDPSWQIPDNRSAYPQSFDFTKIAGELIDLGKDDWFNDSNNQLTMSVWISKDRWGDSNYQTIASKLGPSGATYQWRIAYPGSANKLNFLIQGATSPGVSGTTKSDTITLTSAQTDPDWLHIVWRHNAAAGTSQVILNGDTANATTLTNVSAFPYAQPQTTISNLIGNISNGFQPFDGKISNFQWFNTYFTDAAVETLYNDGVPLANPGIPSQAWYKLDNTEVWSADHIYYSIDRWEIDNNKYPSYFKTALEFNANEYVSLDLDGTGGSSSVIGNGSDLDLTFSYWVNPDYQNSKGSFKWGTGPSTITNWFINIGHGRFPDRFLLTIYNDTNIRIQYEVPTRNIWYHLIVTRTASDNTWRMYVNDELIGSYSDGGTVTAQNYATKLFLGNGRNNSLEGFISNAYIWNSSLSAADRTLLYNNGRPLSDLSSLSAQPFSWWKLDNKTTGVQDSIGINNATITGGRVANTLVSTQAVYSSGMTEQSLVNNNVSVLNGESVGMNSTNLVQSNLTRTQPYSNYSFNFDGTNEIEISQFTLSGAFTLSVWLNADTFTGGQAMLFGDNDSNSYKIEFNGTTTIAIKNAGGNTSFTGSAWNTNEWQHLLISRDASDNIVIYRNATSWSTGTKSGNILFDRISGFNSSASHFNGKLSNISIFDEALVQNDVLNLYNNGVPQDLNNFKITPTAWYPMDQRSSYYDGTDWVVRDLINGNNGQGANTGNVDDLVGNAPGSEASGTGTNLTIADLKGNMYASKNNAYSINMADYADGVINPANSGRSTEVP